MKGSYALWWFLGMLATAAMIWLLFFRTEPQRIKAVDSATNTCFSVSGKGDDDYGYNVCISDAAVEHLSEVWR